MRILVVYYSVTGNNKKIAGELAKMLHADTDAIVDAEEPSKLTALVGAALKKETEILPLAKNPAAYDGVIVCTPIRAGRLPAATRAFLRKYQHAYRRLAYVSACILNNPLALAEFREYSDGPLMEIFVPQRKQIEGKVSFDQVLLDEDVVSGEMQEKLKKFISEYQDYIAVKEFAFRQHV